MNKAVKIVPLLLGPFVGLLVLYLLSRTVEAEDSQIEPAFYSLAIGAWMAVWWIAEAVPLAVTALIPLFFFPFLSVRPLTAVIGSYAHPLIFLFLGGFIISLALQKWSLDRRFAIVIVNLIGREPKRLVAGVMLATAILSMWISNTATSIMMLPIALSLISSNRSGPSFNYAVLLAVAYGASIGGIATIIGTPPNTFVASYLKDVLAEEIGFVEWMAFGLPLATFFLLTAWAYLVFFRYPFERTAATDSEPLLPPASPMSFPHFATLLVFGLVALGWLTRRWLNGIVIRDTQPLAPLTDAHIAMGGAICLFLLPALGTSFKRVLAPADLIKVPWGTLILFGGGLALSSTIKATGADAIIGGWVSALPALPSWLVLATVVAFVVAVTELTSNIATTATLVPILAASAQILGVDVVTLVVATAFSASCAFMLPVATPPNAIVYGSGQLPADQMARSGFLLNIIATLLISLSMYSLFPYFRSF
ncbi:MAG: SLC13 family permease [Pseudomonadota bacterium]